MSAPYTRISCWPHTPSALFRMIRIFSSHLHSTVASVMFSVMTGQHCNVSDLSAL